MNMKSIEVIYGILFVLLGIIASRSDFKEGRIYNKVLAIFTFAAVILGMVYYGYYARDLIIPFLINFVMVAIISLILFYSHSFAGGDCKLVLVMAFLYPANYYLIYGDSTITLLFAIGIAILYGYIYLLVSSIYRLIRGENKMTKEYVKRYILSFLKSFISATIYISAINVIVIYLHNVNIDINPWIIRTLCMGIAWVIGKYEFLRKWYIILGGFILELFSGLFIGVIPFSFNPENYILVIILLICQMTIKTSLYEDVQISELKKGMILSTFSSTLMQGSRVRGLPGISSEDLRSRITLDEIHSIKRWAESKKISSLTIVRKIPFAVFIFLGFVSYFIIWSVVK